MSTGKVKWFNPQKGFGFIEPEDKSTDVFVHITAVQNSGMDGLAEDQMVSYELETGPVSYTHLTLPTILLV